MKKLLLLFSLTLVQVLALSVSSANAQAVTDEFTEGDFIYEVTSVTPLEVKVDGYATPLTTTVATVPATITDTATGFTYDVTALDGNNLRSNSVIEELYLPTSITTLPENGFRDCNGLTTLGLDNITTVEGNGLGRIDAMVTLNLPNVVTVADFAFVFSDALTTINFGSSLTTVSSQTFDIRTTGLTTINIDALTPPTNTSATAFTNNDVADSSAFFGAINLVVPNATAKTAYEADAYWSIFNVVDGSLATELGDSFTVGDYNYEVTGESPDEAQFTGFATAGITIANIPSTATNPASSTVYTVTTYDANTAFKANAVIEDVTLPSTVTDLPDYSLQNCSALHTFTADGALTVGLRTFENANLLMNLNLNALTDVGSNGLSRIRGITTIDLPAIEVLGPYAFVFNDALETLNLGANLTTVNFLAFDIRTTNLTTINMAATTPPTITDGTAFSNDDVVAPSAFFTAIDLVVPNPTAKAAYELDAAWSAFNVVDATTLSNNSLDTEVISLTVAAGALSVSNTNGATNIAIYDIIGKSLVNVNGTTANIANLNTGVYIVKVTNGPNRLVKRIFIKN